MNIALIGAPGSGKSKLARSISTKLREDDHNRKVAIVDDYVAEAEKFANIAMGPLADYIGNLYVALGRYAGERRKREWAEVTITCGTLIETAVYMAMHFVALANNLDEEGKLSAAPEMNAALRMLALLYNDIFAYDQAFYLPPREVDDDVIFMDRQLQAGLAGFKLIPVTPLANLDTQLEDVLEAMSSEAPAL